MQIPLQARGRYVRIQLFKNVYLNMAEVEVIGRFLSSSESSSKGCLFDFDDLAAL
jgi:hypothetical protein